MNETTEQQTADELQAEGTVWLHEYYRQCEASPVLTPEMRDFRRMALHYFYLANEARKAEQAK